MDQDTPMLRLCLTTIAPVTASAAEFAVRACGSESALVVAGDRKGPGSYDLANTTFLSLQDQLDGPFELARQLPTGHYCRKNIAYLEAIRQGATCIYETDDDNAPLPDWKPREEYLDEARVVADSDGRWVNVYRYFTDELIWPRGLPLDEIRTPVPPGVRDQRRRRAPIQQGLVNGSPDVDAIWRLALDRPFTFDDQPSVYLQPGNWCPFNTQSTWWWPVTYPLLYIPSHCSFRMCDIWKSFVAQRCLWEMGLGVAFHAPEVVQERNAHDLMRDFSDEILGYQRNRELAELLAGAPLAPGEDAVAANLLICYQTLVAAEFFPTAEVELVELWLRDLGCLPHS